MREEKFSLGGARLAGLEGGILSPLASLLACLLALPVCLAPTVARYSHGASVRK